MKKKLCERCNRPIKEHVVRMVNGRWSWVCPRVKA